MISDELLFRYIDGEADEVTSARIEKSFLDDDDDTLDRFIALQEGRLLTPSADFTENVMREIDQGKELIESELIKSKRWASAACFFSAAAVILLTYLGVLDEINEFIFKSPDLIKNIIEGINIIKG